MSCDAAENEKMRAAGADEYARQQLRKLYPDAEPRTPADYDALWDRLLGETLAKGGKFQHPETP